VAAALPDQFTEDNSWLVQAIDPGARLARLVKVDREAIRDSSFLDDRFLLTKPEAILCDLDQLVEQTRSIDVPPAGWIFHIGHVGSTLVSRLIGELEGVSCLREPRSLRDLSVATDGERPVLASALGRAMARRSNSDRLVTVKATSFVSEYASLLAAPGSSALFLYATPQNYISGILAGENSVKELAALASLRAARLASRGIRLDGFDRDDARRAAAAWACEMTSLEAAANSMPGQPILWADFDRMLEDMPVWLARTTAHFGLEVPSDELSGLATGPLMRRYSKALEYDYSPSLRAELLAEAGRDHLCQINEAVVALHEAAKTAPLLDRALRRAAGEI